MKRSKFSEHQIIAILKAVEAGRTVKEVCREHEVSDATYYKWKTPHDALGDMTPREYLLTQKPEVSTYGWT